MGFACIVSRGEELILEDVKALNVEGVENNECDPEANTDG